MFDPRERRNTTSQSKSKDRARSYVDTHEFLPLLALPREQLNRLNHSFGVLILVVFNLNILTLSSSKAI